MGDFASLLNQLFATYRKADGSEYFNTEVAEELGRTASYVARLRHGKIPNPGRDTILGLCRFFKVEPSYFFPEIKQIPLLSPDERLNEMLQEAGYDEEAQILIKGILERFKQSPS